jgi:hypothetical protein
VRLVTRIPINASAQLLVALLPAPARGCSPSRGETHGGAGVVLNDVGVSSTDGRSTLKKKQKRKAPSGCSNSSNEMGEPARRLLIVLLLVSMLAFY